MVYFLFTGKRLIFVLDNQTMKIRKKLYNLLSISVLFLTCSFASFGQSVSFIDGLQRLQKFDYDGAKALFLQEISLNPNNDAAYYYLASIASGESNAELAEEYLKKALELSPDNFWYKYNLAIIYGGTDRMELSAGLMEELIEEYPKKSSLYFDVINSYIILNDTDKAIATLDKIEANIGKNEMIALSRLDLMTKSPNADVDSAFRYLENYYQECRTPRIASTLGDYYVRTYRDSLAVKRYDEAIEMDANFTPAYYGKATINQMLRQYDSYFENISHFIKDASFNPIIKAEYVSSLLENAQFVQTFAKDFDDIMTGLHEAHPQDTTINALLSSYYYGTNRPYLSVELLKQNIELYPDSFGHTFQYLILLYYLNSWDCLIEESSVALQKFPGSRDILQLRAIAFSNKKNLDAAISDFQSILDQKPRDTAVLMSVYTSLASLYQDKGESRSAYKLFDKALKINPGSIIVLNNYAYYLAEEGKNLKKAKQMSQKAIEAEPNNPTYLDTYAWILHLLGQNVEAKAIFKHAMLYGGKEDAVILGHYADVLDALGEKDLAKIYHNQVKAMSIE